MKKKWFSIFLVFYIVFAMPQPHISAGDADFRYRFSKFLTIDDLTVTNFLTGRKVVAPFGHAYGFQDMEYVPTVGTNPTGRFFTVSNGSIVSCNRVQGDAITFESLFTFADNRSGKISDSADDVYPKTKFAHAAGCAYMDIGGIPYVFICESWGDTSTYKEQIVYKCRVDYADKQFLIEGAMVIADADSHWPEASDGKAFDTVEEISGVTVKDGWLYACEWSYHAEETPACHIFKVDIKGCTNPGSHRPIHKAYATTEVNRLKYMKNQGIKYHNGRWFITRNPEGKGVYEVKINENPDGSIKGIEYLGEISGQRVEEEEGVTEFGGDLVYFYNNSAQDHPAYRIRLTASVRSELIEIPLKNFPGCQKDYDDLRVYLGEMEIPRVISEDKLKFLANNFGQGFFNPYPVYSICYGNDEAEAPSYGSAHIKAINEASLSGNIDFWLIGQ